MAKLLAVLAGLLALPWLPLGLHMAGFGEAALWLAVVLFL